MGCGPHWPLCQGQLFPPLNDPALVIEWTHRLFAVLVGLSMGATAIVAWRRENPLSVWLATASLGLVGVAGIVGGITVLFDLPKEISTAHLALGVLVFSLLVVLVNLSFGIFSGSTVEMQTGAHRWSLVSVIVVYLQIVLGAYVRHSQAGMALPAWPFLTFLPNLAISPITHQWSHRLLGLIIVALVSVTAAKAIKSGYKAAGISSLALVFTQILLGILTVWTMLNPFVAMLHLAGALALLGTLISLTMRSWPQFLPLTASQGVR